ncbi:MAG: hypothetical protein QOD12_2393 [Verrucomicrobiota bacterium]
MELSSTLSEQTISNFGSTSPGPVEAARIGAQA